ncbi:MAG TPA: hypothetical protein VLA92_00600 [Candidatus Saccharimonadales bacterium]|nr:hypothetical protein [Candidatus Saccharimonadales bacterium]
MGRHRRTTEAPVAPTPARHRAPKNETSTRNGLGIGFAAAVGIGAVTAAAIFSPSGGESHKATSASTPDTSPTPSPSATKPSATPSEVAPKACPAVDPTLLGRYSSHKIIATPNVTRFDTDSGMEAISRADTPGEAMQAANDALNGKIVVRFATEHDSDVPLHNHDMTDRPTATTDSHVSLGDTQRTLSGVLEAYDGLPQDLGTLRGNPLAVVLTSHIITPDNKESVNAGWVGENGTDSFLMTEMNGPAAKTRDIMRHETGHYIHEAGAGSMPEVDCFQDPSIKRPTHLTLYAQQNSGDRETAADTFGIGIGAHYSDEAKAAPYDPTNSHNYAVLMARIADKGPQEKEVADALYNLSPFSSVVG